jgi:hypothetical protein
VAILGPYARIADENGGRTEIIDCVKRTVTTLSANTRAVRFEIAPPDLGPVPTPDPATKAMMAQYSSLMSATIKTTIAVATSAPVTIDAAPRPTYMVKVTQDISKSFADALFTKFGKAVPTTSFSTAQLAFGDQPVPVVVCPSLADNFVSNDADRGIVGMQYARAVPYITMSTISFAPQFVTPTHSGPELPSQIVLAESGTSLFARVGAIRELTAADAALFAVPSDVVIDPLAPYVLGRPH